MSYLHVNKQLLLNGIVDFCMGQNWTPMAGQYSVPVNNKYCYQDQYKEKEAPAEGQVYKLLSEFPLDPSMGLCRLFFLQFPGAGVPFCAPGQT